MDENALAKSDPKEDIQKHTDLLLENLIILEKYFPQLLTVIDWTLLRLACIYHDLGKLYYKFQHCMRTKRPYINEIPHGLLSLAFINYRELRKEGFTVEDIKLLFHVIAYHHDRNMPYRNEDVEKEFAGLCDAFSRFKYDKLQGDFVADRFSERYFSVNDRFYESDGDIFFRFVMLEGLLNRLDYAASAHIDVETPNDFLEESMEKLMDHWQKEDAKSNWNAMQEYMKANAAKNVIVIGQTGMGKTEAGLLWLGNNKGFFTLPLKSAINAIYQRIISNIILEKQRERVGLLHSDTFIQYLELDEKSKQNEPEEDLPVDIYYTKTKQLSLPLTICTLDQLFPFVFRYRGFEHKLATLAYSKIIIDEVQMYSPELLAYLVLGLHYITKLGGKFAILTATLPTFFIDLLQEQKIPFEPVQKFTDNTIRHSLKVLDKAINAKDIISLIKQYGGKKILVICNTIKSATDLYHQLKKEPNVYLLHGCFIKADKKEKEEHILEMGDPKNTDSGIWITTQIVEASLDIDFDLLFTELSDLNGLFQRMGRCYRKRTLDIDYNCFVFTGGSKRCSGVGAFIDKTIHNLSKEALSDVDGVIREDWKVAMVEKLYTQENLPEYYKKIKELISYVQSYQANELTKKEAIKEFRRIENVSVIPRTVYEEHKADIAAAVDDLKANYTGMSKPKSKAIKEEARNKINNLTVDISKYLVSNMEIKIEKINSYEQIIIANCDYDSSEGLIKPVLKPNAEITDFSAHSF